MYRSFYDAAKNLPDANRRVFYDLLMVYMMDGEVVDCDDPIALALFQMAKPQIDANNKKYKNGKRGGRPKKDDEKGKNEEEKNQNKTKEKPNENQNKTETEPNVNVNENVNVNVNENVNEELNTSIPTTSSGKEKKQISSEVKSFITRQADNMPSIAYQIREKGLDVYLEANQKQYELLQGDLQAKEVPIGILPVMLQWIVQSDFRKEQIGSIPKLRKKNRDGVPYWVVIAEKIQNEKKKSKNLVI